MGPFLPRNVVFRRGRGADASVIQTIDPQTMARLSDTPAIAVVAAEADDRLRAALKELQTA